MQISMTDSFIEALVGLAPGDGKRVAAFLDKLLHAPDAVGMQPEIVHEAGDRRIRSLRVSKDLRAIGHIEGDEVVLVYVGRHDDAYAWAAKRCIECHPITGEMQVVRDPGDSQERLASYGAAQRAAGIAGGMAPVTPLFDAFTDDHLLSLGVPPSWLPTVRMIYSEDMLLAVAPDLPPAVADRLVQLATRGSAGPAEPIDRADEDRYRVCTVVDGETLCELLDSVGVERLPEA